MIFDATEKPLEIVRDHFYRGPADKRFHQHKRAVMMALTWPAVWLESRGFKRLSGSDYSGILVDVLRAIYRARGAKPESVEYFPAYLLTAIKGRWEEFYDRSKSLGSAIDRALLAGRRAPAGAADNTVEVLAEAHRMVGAALASGPRPKKLAKATKTDAPQLPLSGF